MHSHRGRWEREKKIEAVIGHKVDENNWIIQIENKQIKLTAWYNWKKRTLQDWTISIDAPTAANKPRQNISNRG